jgi:hypothetical protein
MNDDIYHLQTTVRESINTTRVLEEKINQLILLIDSKNDTIQSIKDTISLHRQEFLSADNTDNKNKINDINLILWNLAEENI